MKSKKLMTLSLAALLGIGAGITTLTSCGSKSPNSSSVASQNVTTKVVSKLEVAAQPTKLVYNEGEKLDLTGMKINVVYTDNSKEDVTSKCTTNLDDKALTASNTNFFVVYKYTEDGKNKTKSVSINITVNAEEVERPTLNKDYLPTKAVLPHNVLKTTEADMVFWGYYDSTSMKNSSILELVKKTETEGTFTFTEENGIMDGVEKIGIIKGEYKIDGTTMTLQSKTVDASKTEKYSGATKEVVTIDKEGDKIVGLNFGSMAGSETLWGWSKSKASSFVEGGATKHSLAADVFYMDAVTDHAIPEGALDYYKIDKVALLDGANPRTNYYVGDKFDASNISLTVDFVVAESSTETNMKGLTITNNIEVDTETPLVSGQTSIKVGYDGASFDLPITVEELPAEKAINGIRVKTAPTKTSYKIGEKFDPTGMVVEATYTDDSAEEITDYKVEDKELTPSDKTITIYSSDEKYQTTVDITVAFIEPWVVAQESKADMVFLSDSVISSKKKQYTCIELFGDKTSGTFTATMRFTTQNWGSGNNVFVYRGTYSISGTEISFAPTYVYTDKPTTSMFYNPSITGSLTEGSAFRATIGVDGDKYTGLTFASGASATDKVSKDGGEGSAVNNFFAVSAEIEIAFVTIENGVVPESILSGVPTL